MSAWGGVDVEVFQLFPRSSVMFVMLGKAKFSLSTCIKETKEAVGVHVVWAGDMNDY